MILNLKNKIKKLKGLTLVLLTIVLLVSCSDYRSEYYENGKLKLKCETRNNQLNGTCEKYYESGELLSEIEFKDGIQDGVSKWYYLNGKLQQETMFSNGSENGLCRNYYETGELLNKIKFINGKEAGVYKAYFKSGDLSTEVNFIDGKQEGLLKEYYNNGGLKSKQMYINGNRKGMFESYYSNSSIKMKSFSENDSTVIYYVKYDSLGSWIKESRDVYVNEEKDNIQIGEVYKLDVELTGPVEDSVIVFVSFFGENPGKEADKEIREYAIDNKITIEFEPNKLGEWTVHGTVGINNNPDRSIMLNPKIFNVLEGETL